MKKLSILALFLCAIPAWSQTTVNGRVQTGTNALKPATCSPGDQYNAIDTFQILECGPTNTWVTVGAGGLTGSFTAGNTVYASGATSLGAGTVRLDMAGISGANLGAIMNACAAQLSSGTGICDGTNLPIGGTYTISTAVSATTSVVFKFCGQFITQNATITLSGSGAFVEGCPTNATVFSKNANIDQFNLAGSNSGIKYLFLEGNKGSGFTGHGVVLASGSAHDQITYNTITDEAGTAINETTAGTFSVNFINHNTITNWGTHAYLNSGTAQQSIFESNYLQGDGTSTGSAILNVGSAGLYNNFVRDSNGIALVDDTFAGQSHPVNGNRFTHLGGWPALLGHTTLATYVGNILTGGGANGPVAQGGGVWQGNAISALGASDGLDLTSNGAVADGNFLNVTFTSVSNKCALNLLGDLVGVRTSHNTISITASTANTNYGVCSTPSGTHNLDNIVDGDMVSTSLSGGATIFGYWLNNAANLNTNWSLIVENISCVHLTTCIKRTDTQNNRTLYFNIQLGDTTLDNGTGSTADVFVFDTQNFTFATIPTPIGNGSHFYCTDCTQAKPTASGGGGAFVVREAGANNGL